MVCIIFLMSSAALLREACKKHSISLTLEKFEVKGELSLKLQIQPVQKRFITFGGTTQ